MLDASPRAGETLRQSCTRWSGRSALRDSSTPALETSALESTAMQEPTQSFWLDGVPGQDVGADAPLPQRADVVVIGGGITGTSAAYWLGAHDIPAVVLEARGLSGGASGRNGGHISPG